MFYDSRKVGLIVVFLLNSVLLVGCGGGADAVPQGDVSGAVKVNGQPVTQGKITFTSAALGAAGSADLAADGTYTFPGPLPAGEYKVYFSEAGLGDRPPSEDPKADAMSGLKDVPEKYQSEQSTDLTATVEKGSNDIPFEL